MPCVSAPSTSSGASARVFVGGFLEREQTDLRAVAVRDHELVLGRDRREAVARDAGRSHAGSRRSSPARAAATRCRPGRRRVSSRADRHRVQTLAGHRVSVPMPKPCEADDVLGAG